MKAIKTPLRFEYGKVATTTDVDVIAQQKILDVLVTSPGERVMRPTYGAGVYNLLFDYPDELVFSDFKVDALQDITQNVTGVILRDLTIAPSEEAYSETSLDVMAYYQIPPSGVSSVKINISNPDEFV